MIWDEDTDIDFELVTPDSRKTTERSISEQVAAMPPPNCECYFCGTPGFPNLRAVTRTRWGHATCEDCLEKYKRR